jgi:hypothetical protein
MDPQFTRPFRASIVARARFIEDLVVEQAGRGLSQYVILGVLVSPALAESLVRKLHDCRFVKLGSGVHLFA